MPTYCRQCGAKLSPSAKFCKQCGFQILSDDQTSKDAPSASIGPKKAGREARSARPSSKSSKRSTFKVLPIAIGGISVLLCIGVLVGGVLLFRQILLGRQVEPGEVAQYEESSPIEEDNAAGYTPRQVALAETTPESATGATSSEPTTINLSDGSEVLLPGSARQVQVTLSRESNTIELTDKPDLQTSGSMRVIEFDPAQIDENFLPALTIPAQELGALDPATVNAVRVGDVRLDDELIRDHVSILPVVLDENNNLVIFDGLTASLANPEAANNKTGTAKLARHTLQNRNTRVKYVLMTFQKHLEWEQEPRLVRMIPDGSLPGYRRPADKKKDKELLEKPVTNVVILVHGHNEYEKDGRRQASAEEPWKIHYKWDVWIEFYKSFLDTKKDQVDCTAFYEFIYPTYRPIYSPLMDKQVDTLGYSMARILTRGALNDNYQLEKMAKANMPVNLTITAHSMGGLVARDAIRQSEGWLVQNFQKLVTWGTPHHGSPLITFGYLVHGPYRTLEGGTFTSIFSTLLGKDSTTKGVDQFVQLDTPGERDLRWDNFQPLRLDDLFLVAKDSIPSGVDAGQFELNKGAWLFNSNLTAFNQDDPHRNGEKYHFLYGITSKRYEKVIDIIFRETATGATIISGLMKNADAAMPSLTGKVGDSDGAVPLASMAGVRIADFHADYLGDIDHEEYFGHTSDVLYGDKVARWTFDRLGLAKPRCACADLVVESPGSLEGILVDTPLDVVAKLKLDPALDSSPGRRVKSAEAFFQIAGTLNEISLGDLTVKDSGELSGEFTMPDLGKGAHKLIIRARFKDGTLLESLPLSKALYTEMFANLQTLHTADCDITPDRSIDRSFTTFGPIATWTGDGKFTITPEPERNEVVELRNVATGRVSPDGKTVSLWLDYASHYEHYGSFTDKTLTASVIDIPFVQHVNRDGWEYDLFALEGELPQLAGHLTYHRTVYEFLTEYHEVFNEVDVYDPNSTCNSRSRIEIWMFIIGPFTPR